MALFESGVRVLAGTDAPNPGLVHGASLHRELQHLVRAGLRPAEALTAATSTPAEVFGLTDRGRLVVGSRADLVLIDGDPTIDITATQRLRTVWVGGREAITADYAGSSTERDGIVWLRESTAKIIAAIRDMWPGFPAPEDVRRDDGELLGRLVPTAGGWQATTVFAAPLGGITSHDDALETLLSLGMSCLAEPWWMRGDDETDWREVHLMEIRSDRVRVRWADRTLDQPPSGRWFGVQDVDLTLEPPGPLQLDQTLTLPQG